MTIVVLLVCPTCDGIQLSTILSVICHVPETSGTDGVGEGTGLPVGGGEGVVEDVGATPPPGGCPASDEPALPSPLWLPATATAAAAPAPARTPTATPDRPPDAAPTATVFPAVVTSPVIP